MSALPAGRLGDDHVGLQGQPEPCRQPGRHRGALQELAPGVVGVRRDRPQAFSLEWVPDVAHAPASGAHAREP